MECLKSDSLIKKTHSLAKFFIGISSLFGRPHTQYKRLGTVDCVGGPDCLEVSGKLYLFALFDTVLH